MRTSTLFFFALLLWVTAVDTSLSAQDGTFDESFGVHGKVVVAFDGNSSRSYDVAVQPDSRILLGGSVFQDPVSQVALVRLLPDGTPDSTFGTNGKVIASVGNSEYTYTAEVLIQPDGKIIQVGIASVADWNKLFVLRYHPDGTPDNTFGTNGKFVTTTATGYIANVKCAKLQPDGKIVVSGSTSGNSFAQDVVVLRVLPNGKPDDTFDLDGKVVTDLGSVNDAAPCLALQEDGKIVVAGWTDVDQFSSKSDMALLRYLPDGSLDETFGDLGITIASFSEVQDYPRDIMVLPDGDILVTGYFQVPLNNYYFTLVKFKADGTRDTGFGNGGIRQYDLGTNDDTSRGMARQADGKIILYGATPHNFLTGHPPITLLRLNTDYSVDSTFGTNGVLKVGGGNDLVFSGFATDIALQPDGNILLASDTAPDSTDTWVFCAFRIISGLDVGVLDFSASKNTVLVYPNPVQTEAVLQYTLERDENLTVTLHDLNGRLLHTCLSPALRKAGEHRETLSVPAALPPGAYVLSIGNGKQRMGIKMMKQ